MTPWGFSPLWFVLLSVFLPAALWTALAWKCALEEDPHRERRAGLRELRRLLARCARTPPRPVDLHAWFQAAARTWGVRVSTPTLSALGGDEATQARWRTLWKDAERRLYAANATLSPDWIRETTDVANQVRIPPRQHWFPVRARHWLPSIAAGVCACVMAAEPQAPATEPLRADWNNWAAHYTVGVQQRVQGNADYAVAHLTAAFLQRPSSSDVQDNLRGSLQQAGSMDPTLRRLLYGAWFQRYPTLLSPANWQRLGLFASVLIGGGLCAFVLSMYTTRRLRARWAVATGCALLTLSVMSWNAWGDLHEPNAAMLVEGVNVSPAPTDLVKDRETLPMKAGSLTLIHKNFLGWKQVDAGWVRSPYVMPLYATN